MSHAGKLLRTHKRRNSKGTVKAAANRFKPCACGKQGYTQEDVLLAALSVSGHKGKPFRTYKCIHPKADAMRSWHLTSKVDRPRVA